MTEDKEWSLKDKIHNHLKFYDYDTQYYNRKDIETLRQKLIEDVGIWIKEHENDCVKYTSFAHYNLQKIINKRFGVKE